MPAIGLALLLAAPTAAIAQQSATPQPAPSKFKSPDDGWIDLSGFMASRYGFLPVASPITEPAVGLGLAAGLAFMSAPVASGRPNITAIGGLGTENGTKGAFAGDIRYWLDHRVQTIVKVVYASVNLDFYGIGHDSVLADNPLRYNLEPAGASFEVKGRVGGSAVWIGASYAYAHTGVRFDAPEGTPGRPDTSRTSREGGVSPSLTVDTRDNMFTPIRGTYVEGRADIFSTSLGGDDDFQRLRVVGMQFVPLKRQVFLGIRGEAAATFGDAPFYLRPFIYQRGIPAMRYQGDHFVQIETEVRWQYWKRNSADAFAGGGKTWTGSNSRERSDQAAAGGLGFRYELARAYGIHVGADFAYGPAGHAFYIQIGSAWARP
jgi:outer membrane protein assembly factor BamA